MDSQAGKYRMFGRDRGGMKVGVAVKWGALNRTRLYKAVESFLCDDPAAWLQDNARDAIAQHFLRDSAHVAFLVPQQAPDTPCVQLLHQKNHGRVAHHSRGDSRQGTAARVAAYTSRATIEAVLCRSARVKLTVIKSLMRNGALDIGHNVFDDGALISVGAAPGVREGSQNAGSFGTTLPASVWIVSLFIASILPAGRTRTHARTRTHTHDAKEWWCIRGVAQ